MTTAAGPPVAVAAASVPRQHLDLVPQRDVLERELASFPGDRPHRRERISEDQPHRRLPPRWKRRLPSRSRQTERGSINGTAQLEFTDVIVDITALPTSISFPLLGQLLNVHDRARDRGSEARAYNLHCVVCENPELDERIVHEGGDSADYIDTYRGKSGRVSEADPVNIWAPVLGERQDAALRKIYDALSPSEVKPVLPFPSRNPRRGDDLVAEYHALVFETWQVDPRGFLYAHERDPFDVYRQLSGLAIDYERALRPYGTTNTVVSAHTSKLLSLGALLAAYEHNLGVIHVEPTDYSLDDALPVPESNELFEVWLAGEAYDHPV